MRDRTVSPLFYSVQLATATPMRHWHVTSPVSMCSWRHPSYGIKLRISAWLFFSSLNQSYRALHCLVDLWILFSVRTNSYLLFVLVSPNKLEMGISAVGISELPSIELGTPQLLVRSNLAGRCSMEVRVRMRLVAYWYKYMFNFPFRSLQHSRLCCTLILIYQCYVVRYRTNFSL